MSRTSRTAPRTELSVQAEYSVNAAKLALARAGRTGEDVDLVVLGASNLQRLYPAIAIEVQNAIGARGYGFDISLGCSAATGATQLASQAVQLGQAKCALVVVPELTTGHMNWRERDSHFIFGDASVVARGRADRPREGRARGRSCRRGCCRSGRRTRSATTRAISIAAIRAPSTPTSKLFHQQGRRVFKDVVPMASKFITRAPRSARARRRAGRALLAAPGEPER